jgi:cytochrome c oxidase cbb3-type subunit 4
MDLVNAFRSLVTVTLFILFLVIVAWAYSSRNRGAFDEAAALPFQDDAPTTPTMSTSSISQGGTRE